ncbi:MAG: hypothetical protein U0326_33940 [Polyangiales bacterium]
MIHRPLAAVLCVSLSLVAPAAAAQPRAVAAPVSPADEAEHARAIELRRLHRDTEARDVFRAIYERTHEPRALARQASAEASLGDWVLAEEHLTAALERADDAWIAQNRAGLQGDLEAFRQHLGLLDVSTSTAHAELWIDGARVAPLPLERPLRVRAGAVTFEVRAEGFTPVTRTATTTPGARILTREMVNLAPAPATPAAPTVTATPAAPTVIVVPAPVAATPEDAPRSWFTPLRIAGLSLAGLGVVGIGVGVAGLVIKSGHEGTLDRDPCASDAMLTMQTCIHAADGADSASTLSLVGFVTGGVLAVGGAVLMILPDASRSRAPRVSLSAGPGTLGLGLRAAF